MGHRSNVLIALALAARAGDERLLRPPGDIGEVAVMAIAQDADGWLWFGGVDGLHRYDGARRTKWGGDFFNEPNEIYSVENGVVTVMAQDRRLYRLEATRWAELTGPDGAALGAVEHAAWSDGVLWVLQRGALSRFVDGTWTATPAPILARLLRAAAGSGVWLLGDEAMVRLDRAGAERERQAVPRAKDVAVTASGGWAAGADGRIWHWDADGVRALTGESVAWGESVIAVDGGAWVATTTGLLRFEGDRLVGRVPVPQGIPQHDAMLLDHEGTLWVGTHTGPRQRTRPDTWILDTPGPYGFTWLAPGAGAAHLWATAWSQTGTIDVNGVWQNTPYMAFGWPMCQDAQGRTWSVGRLEEPYSLALLTLADTLTVQAPFPPDSGLGGCAPAPDGGMWIGTWTGLKHFGPDGLRPVESPLDGTAGLTQDAAGVLHLLGGEQECHADAAAVLAHAADWTCSPWPGAPPRQVVEVRDAATGASWMWAVGPTVGVLAESAAGWVRHVSSTELTSPTVWSLVPSPRGGVWVVGLGGILRVAPSPPDRPWTVLEDIDADNGLPPGGGDHLVEDADGTLWIATQSGVVRVPPTSRELRPALGTPVAADIWLNGVATVLGDTPLLGTWPHNQVEIRAAVATYAERSRLRWRARLQQDATPLTASPDPTLRIVDLPAGSYAIVIEASLDGGKVWSPASAPVRLEVRLPWYLRPPALIAAVLLTIGAVWGVVRLRMAAAARVDRERTRIAMDLHDDLGAGLSTITMLTGLAADESLTDGARREVASEAALTAATLTDSLADIVWTLRRDTGRPGVLARSLVERGRRLFPSGSPRFVVDVAAEWPDRALSLALYRNVQLIGYEALHNAARHANAREVTLRFYPWTLEILDDGQGLSTPSSRAGTGTGLVAMRERARAVGATLEVVDRPGGGTCVRLGFSPRG